MTPLEQFTAVAMCPRCSAVGVWPWREPRKAPKGSDPVSVAERRIAASMDRLYLMSWDYGDTVEVRQWGGNAVVRTKPTPPRPKSYFDPDEAVVVRQCRCGHEWGQR